MIFKIYEVLPKGDTLFNEFNGTLSEARRQIYKGRRTTNVDVKMVDENGNEFLKIGCRWTDLPNPLRSEK